MDELDQQILRALQENGRVPFTQIARRSGVSETTIRTRYHSLVRQGIVHTVGIIDPHALGYEATAIVTVSVEPGMADPIARTMAQIPEVSRLVRTLGSYDLILEIFCRDLSHLTNVVTRQIHPISGVRATETFMVAESYKPLGGWSPELGPGEKPGAD
jgi:Lrp/AsnC family transcriptional regulator for asnA, asnC and gidA